MNAAASDGDDSRMSRPTAMRFALRYATNAAPMALVLGDLAQYAADVVGLEDSRSMLIAGCSRDDGLVAEDDAVLDGGVAADGNAGRESSSSRALPG
jgi:hypothetical protein